MHPARHASDASAPSCPQTAGRFNSRFSPLKMFKVLFALYNGRRITTADSFLINLNRFVNQKHPREQRGGLP